jgi:predicted phosphodiesterase
MRRKKLIRQSQKNKGKPTAILCSDIHLRLTTPKCRTDNYFDTQAEKIKFIVDLREEYNCPILSPGDLFNKAKVDQELEIWAIENLPKNMVLVPGQHDLPNHNLKLFKKSSLGVLHSCGKVEVLLENKETLIYGSKIVRILGFPFGVEPKQVPRRFNKEILMAHYFTYLGKTWPGNQAPHARQLLRRLNKYDLILTGDNHIPFVLEEEGRLLVNPGSLMRLKSDQINHKPRVYLWYAESNTVEPVYIPIRQDVIDISHIEKQQERDERMEAFISIVKTQEKISFNFISNLENYFRDNKEPKEVKEIVWECLRD